MFKQNKFKLIITSLIILLPMLYGLAMWEQLPDTLPIHWSFNNQADGHGSRAFAVFGIPLIMLGVHWLCFCATLLDKFNRQQNRKAMGLVQYIFPFISLIICSSVYSAAAGSTTGMFILLPLVMGLMFILIGNYMPKCRLNRTLGVKLPWTIANTENWNRTHRFAGYTWVIGGAVLCLSVLLPLKLISIIAVSLLILMIALPTLYSYLLYRKMKAEGRWEVNGVTLSSRGGKISVIFCCAILAFAAILMLTGNIAFTLDEDSLDIAATYWSDSTIPYTDISSVEYREDGVDGVRTSGFGSARLLMGQFRNDEFGAYTRYTYTGNQPAIVLTIAERTLVIGTNDAEETLSLYNELNNRISDN